jgi:hypothetical protein
MSRALKYHVERDPENGLIAEGLKLGILLGISQD